MRRRSKAVAAIFSATAAVAGAMSPAQVKGQTITWSASTGDFNTPSNWNGGVVPGSAATASINNGGTATIGSGDGTISVTQLWAGDNSGSLTGNVLQSGGTLNTSSDLVVGNAGSTGTYNITGGVINASGSALRLFGNSSIDPTGASTWMDVSGSAVINNSTEFDIGYNNGTTAGAATLNIMGGTLNHTASTITVGNGANVTGNLYMSSGTLNNTGGTLIVGEGSNSTGNFNLTGGTINTNQTIAIGEGSGATGLMVMNGSNTTINTTGQVWIADANNASNHTGGTGTLIMNGGTIISNNWFVVGRGGSSNGLFIMNGGTIVHTNDSNNSNSFEVGSYGGNNGTANNATFNMNGGTLSTGYIRDESPTGGTQSIYLNGGTLISNDGDSGFIGGHTNGGDTLNVYLRNNGVTLNAGGNGGEMGITSPISHSNAAGDNAIDGGINIAGGGNVTLTAANTFTGNVTVTNSELQVLNDSSFGNGNIITLNNGEIHNDGYQIGPGGISASRTIQLEGTGYLTPGWSGYTVNGPIVDYPGTTGNNLSIPYDSGVLLLNGNDSYTGTTTLGSVGVTTGSPAAGLYYYNNTGATVGLELGADNALPAGTLFTFGVHPLGLGVATTLNMNGHQATIGGLVGQSDGHIDNKNSGSTSTLTLGDNVGYSASGVGQITSSSSFTYSGTIQNSAGTINIVKTGPGIQVLSGSNLYTGSTTINQGKLYFNSPLLSSAVTVNSGGTLGGTGVIGKAVTVNSGGTVEAGYLGAGSLNLSGGVSFASGSTLSIGNASNYIAPDQAGVLTTSLTDTGTVGVSVTSALSGLAVGSQYDLLSYTSESGGGTFNLSGTLPLRASGTLSDTGSMIVLTITGVDFLKWTGANGTAWDTSSLNWELNSNNQPTAYIDNPGDNVVFDDSAGSNQSVTVATPVHPNAVTFNNSTYTYSLSGAGGIAGLLGLTKTGTALVTLDTSNTYTGATQVQQGTLQLGTGGSLSAQTSLVLGSGSSSGTFVLGDSTGAVNTTVASLTTAGTGTANSVQGGNSSAVSTLTVSTLGSDTYSGTLGGSTATAKNVAIAFNGGPTGAGTLTLSGTNNYTGGTVLNSGTLVVTNNNSLGTGPFSLTGTAASATGGPAASAAAANGLVAITGNVVLSNAFNLNNGNIIFNTNGYTMNISGAVSNNPTLAQIITPIGGGNLILSGPLNLSSTLVENDGNNSPIEETSNNTTVSITGTGNVSGFSVAFYNSTNTLILNPAGTLTVANPTDALVVGQQGGNGIVVQNGGTVNMGDIWLGRWDGSYGSYTMNGGTLTSVQILEGGASNGNGNSVWIQNGGTVNVAGYTTLGEQGSSHASWVLNNGSYISGNAFTLGDGTTATNATVVNGTLTAASIVLAGASGGVQSILNLNGGEVLTGSITAHNSAPLSIVNFNGTQVVATASSGNFLASLTQANVYAGGAIFNTAGNTITVTQNLTSAGGTTGLASIPGSAISTSGSYTGAPVVVISGGGGTGATGYATVSNGAITGVTITNPGTGYSSGTAPTFSFYGGGGTGATVNNFTTVTNAADGGLTKLGAGNLILSGNNTYTGGTQVKGGTLTVENNSALGTGNAYLSAGTTLALGYVPATTSLSGFSANNGGNFTPVIAPSGNSVQMTSASNSEATSVFSTNFYTINDATGFAASFTYSHVQTAPDPAGNSTGPADGVTFTIQLASPQAVGKTGVYLGYAPTVTPSVAAGIDEFQNEIGTGVNGGFNPAQSSAPTGASNSIPWISLSTSNNVSVVYNGVTDTLTETIASNINGASYTLVTTGIDVASILNGGPVGGTGSPQIGYGYIGFTGSTGGFNDSQTISNFSFNDNGMSLPNNSLAISNTVEVLSGATSTVQLGGSPGYSSGTVGPIVINANGTLTVANGAAGGATHGVLTTPSITFNGSGGTLDIANNALDITSQGSTPAANLQQISNFVKSAYANGTWTGTGITSSAAAADSNHLTAVGVIINDNGQGTPLYGAGGTIASTFDGSTPSDGDILVKYTYYGDVNLDGVVDGTDYSVVDNTCLAENFVNGVPTNPISGWGNGDFNYDGVVDGSDYTLIDNAFNQEGASLDAAVLATQTAQIAGTSAVPEPASLGLLAIGASGLLGRRRRHP